MLSREKVPAYGRPILWIFAAVNVAGIYAIALLTVPRARPGIVEFVIGFASAIGFSLPLTRAWVAYLEALGACSEERPLLRVVPADFGYEWFRIQLAALVVFAGMFTVAVLAAVFWFVSPGLSGIWARHSGVARDFPVPIQSMADAAFLYLMACALLLSIGIVRWFRTLPNEIG